MKLLIVTICAAFLAIVVSSSLYLGAVFGMESLSPVRIFFTKEDYEDFSTKMDILEPNQALNLPGTLKGTGSEMHVIFYKR